VSAAVETGEHVTIGEAAELLGVHPHTVRNRIKSGRIPAEKVLTPYGEAFAIPRAHIDKALHAPPYQPLPIPSQDPSQFGGRVKGGSNDLVSLYPEQNNGVGGEVGRGCDPPNVTFPTPTTVGTLTTLVRSLVTPLMELNERQAEELAGLHAAMREQAEELGRERGRREAAELEVERLRRARRARPWWVRLFLA